MVAIFLSELFRNNMSNILFLFTHLFKGGMERAVSNISCSLSSDYCQYICYFGTESPGFCYKGQEINFGLSGGGSVGFFKKIYNAILRIRIIRKFSHEKKINYVVSQGDFANIYNIISMHKSKKILTVHGDFRQFLVYNFFYSHIYFILIKLLYRFSDVIIVASNGLKDQMYTIVGDCVPIKVINNMFPLDDIKCYAKAPLPSEFSFLESKRFIINVGSFCPQKGQDDLIEIFASLTDRHPELYLVLMGRGEMKESLKLIVSRYSLSGQVIWVDFNNNPFCFMSRAEVFVLTSRFEGFGNVLVESMACGTPTVAFDCPSGPSEVLENGKWGILIKNRDKVKMKEAISILLDDAVLRKKYSELGLERSKIYSCGNIISQWENLFREL